MNLFDPEPKIPLEQAHELWCVLEKRFASQVEGKVTVYADAILENSVFQGISLPALLENQKAIINIAGQ